MPAVFPGEPSPRVPCGMVGLTLLCSWWVGYVGGVVCFERVDLPKKMEILEFPLSIKTPWG